MPSLPSEMLSKGRSPDDDFGEDEKLYRRFPPSKNRKKFKKYLGQYSIALPDMSVVRSKFNGKPEFALYDVTRNDKYHSGWGVVSIAVQDIPPETFLNGIGYPLKCKHMPLKRNYQHSEVRIHDSSGTHLDSRAGLPEGLNQSFQARLQPVLRVVIEHAYDLES